MDFSHTVAEEGKNPFFLIRETFYSILDTIVMRARKNSTIYYVSK